ncbi:MAG: sulfotransferase family protein [Aggregatilineaceae bacterium]
MSQVIANTRGTAPIFVVGYMRSGTTLLHSILAAHPEVFCAAHETKFFEYGPLFRHLYPNPANEATRANLIQTLADVILNGNVRPLRCASPGYCPVQQPLPPAEVEHLLAATCTRPTYSAVYRQVFDHLAARAGKRRWIEKTPQHIYFIDSIKAAIPDALFVEIVRDPRDVLASKKRFREAVTTSPHFSANERAYLRIQRVYDPFWDALAWRLAVRTTRRARDRYPHSIFTLSFEQLIAEPEPTVRAVCDFTGLDFDPVMLDVKWVSTGVGIQDHVRGFQSEPLGRWKNTLRSSEVLIAQALTAPYLPIFGYERASVGWRGWVGLLPLLARSGAEFFQRLYRRWQLGGVPFLMTTLTNYGHEVRKLLRRN